MNPQQTPPLDNQQPSAQPTAAPVENEKRYDPSYFIRTDIQDIKTLPWFRRTDAAALLSLLGLIILWTGDMYTQSPDTKIVYKWTTKKKLVFTVYDIVLTIVALLLILSPR